MAYRAVRRIVYTCYGGAHSSPVAAAIHLGLLPRNTTPTVKQLLSIPLFDQVTSSGRGRMMFVGTDARGNEIFVLGRGKESADMVRNLIVSAWTVAGGATTPLEVCDTLPCVNGWMRMGGWLSRAAGLVGLGRPIAAFGARLAYPRLVRLVQQVERRLGIIN